MFVEGGGGGLWLGAFASATSEIVADDNEEYNDYIEPASVVGTN